MAVCWVTAPLWRQKAYLKRQQTRHNNPDSRLQSRRLENLKSHLQNGFTAVHGNVHHRLEESIHPKCCYQSAYCSLIRHFPVQQTIEMRSTVRELTLSAHPHSFCITGVSSGLATRMTLTSMSRGRLGKFIARGVDLLLISFFTVVLDCF
jgi:hypothetical protein